jgi:hypothetical protein
LWLGTANSNYDGVKGVGTAAQSKLALANGGHASLEGKACLSQLGEFTQRLATLEHDVAELKREHIEENMTTREKHAMVENSIAEGSRELQDLNTMVKTKLPTVAGGFDLNNSAFQRPKSVYKRQHPPEGFSGGGNVC